MNRVRPLVGAGRGGLETREKEKQEGRCQRSEESRSGIEMLKDPQGDRKTQNQFLPLSLDHLHQHELEGRAGGRRGENSCGKGKFTAPLYRDSDPLDLG